ncbi:MAG: hypothetical protein K2N38_04145 [Oscillospiraceae bacterium]|nr:hypothetical protein [Oscillospiraceae bacterium]
MTELENYEISREQARALAQAIYADIDDYVKTHQKEFEEFLAEQRKEVVTLCPDKEQSE